MNRFIYVLFVAAVFLISCSGLDKTSNLGGDIIKPKLPDDLQSGVYNTIYLQQEAQTFGSVVDSDPLKFVYNVSNASNRFTQWAVGNWNEEQALLKLSHFKTEKDTISVKDFLQKLADSAASKIVIDTTIKADIVWANSVSLNSVNNAKVEVGAVFNDTSFFPLNFASVNSKLSTSYVPVTLETYLLNEKTDSTIIQRFKVESAFYIDTILNDSTFATKVKTTDTIFAQTPTVQKYQNDTLVLWKHFIASSFYDDALTKIEGENITLFKKKDNENIKVAKITHKKVVKKNIDPTNVEIIDTTFDTLTIVLDTTMTLRSGRKSSELNRTDSIFVYSAKKTHKVIQQGLTYKVPLNDPKKGIRAVGGNGIDDIDVSTLSDTLNMYLKIDETSNVQSILHLSSPALRVIYKKFADKDTTIYYQKLFYFSKIGVLSKSSDILKNETPVTSGALERFAEIDLDLSDFFNEITKEGYLHVAMADLTLNIDGKTDFPAQYGDSIQVNAIISDKELTPKSLYALPNTRMASRFWINRDSSSVKIPLSGTIMDFVYLNSVYEKTAPANAYLYIWLENFRMGRIYFEPSDPEFTYILQVRKGDE